MMPTLFPRLGLLSLFCLLAALLSAFLTAFLSALLLSLSQAAPKDFFVGDAVGEVVDGNPTHGADVCNGAAVEP